MAHAAGKSRIDWVDCAKGVCIILVVMMHSTLGVEKAVGEASWLHPFIAWAKPFRMPDFFLISGLFLAARIDRPWRSYLDSKVIHFAYFYVLWMTIQFLTKGYGLYQEAGLAGTLQACLMGFIEPFGTLWFIYLLAVFFVVVKVLRGVPPIIVFVLGAVLEMMPVETGWLLIDEFASRFVYFYAGYWLARYVFSFAAHVGERASLVIFAGLAAWAVFNGWMVATGLAELPGLSLVLGFIGAGAVIAFSVLFARTELSAPLRYCGKNSIVIYLSFFLFMAASRSLLLRVLPEADPGIVSLIVTSAGVIGPVLLFKLVSGTRFDFLFRRPGWARLASHDGRWHTGPHAKLEASEAR